MPNLRQAVPFFMVTSMERSLSFYVDGLGFERKHDWRPEGKIEWCWLEREGVGVMLQLAHAAPGSSQVQGEKSMSIYFICEDAIALYKEFKSKGMDISEPVVGNQMWVIGIKDPDGNQLYFESSTDVQEETRYAEWVRRK